MPERNYPYNEPEREPVIANPIVSRPRRDDFIGSDDDIEVIDLDTGRQHVKPTTWH